MLVSNIHEASRRLPEAPDASRKLPECERRTFRRVCTCVSSFTAHVHSHIYAGQLLKVHADPSIVDKTKSTALHICAKKGHAEIAQTLIHHCQTNRILVCVCVFVCCVCVRVCVCACVSGVRVNADLIIVKCACVS